MKKRVFSVFLALCLMLTPLPGFALAAEDSFTDIPSDYSTAALNAAVANGLLKGTDGKILPDDSLTRAQMAAVLVRAFGASGTAALTGYTDVKAGAWYSAALGGAVKMKVLRGDGSAMRPDAPMTRQEVFTALARALKLTDGTMADIAAFSDAGSVASWAVGPTAAMVKAGYVHGADGKLNPTVGISRKDFAVVMNNLVKTYVTAAGVVTSVAAGNVMVRVPGATLKNLTVRGNLIIGDGVGDGEVTLENVRVTGAMIVRGGGVNSIVIQGASSVGTVVVSKADGSVRIHVEDSASVEVVCVNDGKDDVIVEGKVEKLEVAASDVPVVVKNAEIAEVVVSADKAELTIDKDSSVKNVTAAGAAPSLSIAGTVGTLTAEKSAVGAKIEVTAGAKVETANVAAEGAAISGSGAVTNANVSGDHVSVSTPDTKVTVAEGATGVKAGGRDVKGGETARTGGGSSDGGYSGPSYPISVNFASVPRTNAVTIASQQQTGANAYKIVLSGAVPVYHKDSSDVDGLFADAPDGRCYAVLKLSGILPTGNIHIRQTNPALSEVYPEEDEWKDNIKDADYNITADRSLALLVGPHCGIITAAVTKDGATTTYTVDCTGLATASLTQGGAVTYYGALADAIAAARDGDTIQLRKDTAENIVIPGARTVALDLNGKTLTDASGDTITVENGASLTISDTSAEQSGAVDNITHQKGALVNNGTATLTGGTFLRSRETGVDRDTSGGNSWYTVVNHGTMTIADTAVLKNKGKYSSMLNNQGTSDRPAVLTVTGGQLSGGVNTIKNAEYATLTIRGGSFNNNVSGARSILLNWGTATITGGVWNAAAADSVITYGKYDETTAGILNIDGGTFHGGFVKHPSATAAGTVSITGGTFSDLSGLEYAADGATITLGADAALTEPLTIARRLTLDLNGKTIAASAKIILNGADADLTIKDSGSDGKIVTATDSFFCVQHGKLTLESGTYTSKCGDNWCELIDQSGSDNPEDSGYSVVTIGEKAVLNFDGHYGYGVRISPPIGTSNEYGIVLNVYGKIDSRWDGENGAGIYVNGTIKPSENSLVPQINIYNRASIIGTNYAAGMAQWKIEGGTFVGDDVFSVKSGYFEISGGDFKAVGAYKNPAVGNNSGSEDTGAAFSITSNDNYAGKTLGIKVRITGGTFTSANGHALYEGIAVKDGAPMAGNSNVTELSVSGGTFIGAADKAAVNVEKYAQKFITGGTFSTDPSTYVAETYKAKEDSGGTWTVGAEALSGN